MRRTEDPLAELARLIGQEDPFADFVAHKPADARAAASSAASPSAQRRPQRTHDSRIGFDNRSAERRRMPLSSRAPEPVPLEEEINFEALDEAPRPANGRGSYAYGGGRTAPTLRTPQPSRADYERYAPSFEEDDAAPQARDARQARRAPAPQHDDDYEQVPAADYDPDYADDAYIPAHGEEFYDEAPPRRLKPWMMVAVAAIAAVLVGTSGLFAYRAVFGTNTASTPPRTIRPEAGPSKMVPGSETKSADNKRIQDRVGEPSSSGERIISREEAPIDPNRIPQGSPTQRIPAGTVTAASPFMAVPTQSAPAMGAPAVPPSTEPRRVRTVTVRSDGTVVADQSRAATPAASAARSGPSSVPPPVSNSPMALQGGGPSASQQAALPPQRPAGSAPQGDNPWANLAGQPAATQAGLPPQTQSAPPAQSAAPLVAVNTPPPAGSYVVQVAAQKTEADAQSSWQALQQRYGSVLGGQQATIRRVDLGERGVFYRAQVGPFSSRAQASEVCQSLKAAGGECVIQRN